LPSGEGRQAKKGENEWSRTRAKVRIRLCEQRTTQREGGLQSGKKVWKGDEKTSKGVKGGDKGLAAVAEKLLDGITGGGNWPRGIVGSPVN